MPMKLFSTILIGGFILTHCSEGLPSGFPLDSSEFQRSHPLFPDAVGDYPHPRHEHDHDHGHIEEVAMGLVDVTGVILKDTPINPFRNLFSFLDWKVDERWRALKDWVHAPWDLRNWTLAEVENLKAFTNVSAHEIHDHPYRVGGVAVGMLSIYPFYKWRYGLNSHSSPSHAVKKVRFGNDVDLQRKLGLVRSGYLSKWMRPIKWAQSPANQAQLNSHPRRNVKSSSIEGTSAYAAPISSHADNPTVHALSSGSSSTSPQDHSALEVPEAFRPMVKSFRSDPLQPPKAPVKPYLPLPKRRNRKPVQPMTAEQYVIATDGQTFELP